MVSHDFIGLLILGLFNVSIGRQQIRADLNYDVMASSLVLLCCTATCSCTEQPTACLLCFYGPIMPAVFLSAQSLLQRVAMHHVLLPLAGGLLEKPEACRTPNCSRHTLALQSRKVSVQATKSDAKSDTHLYLCTRVPTPHMLRLCMCIVMTDMPQGSNDLVFLYRQQIYCMRV